MTLDSLILTLFVLNWNGRNTSAICCQKEELASKSMLFLWSAQSGLQFEMFLSNSIDMVKNLPPLLSLGESRIWGWPEAARPPLAAAAAFCCCAASIALLWSWIEKKIYKVFAWLSSNKMELKIQGMDLQSFGLTLKAIKTKKGLEKTIYLAHLILQELINFSK